MIISYKQRFIFLKTRKTGSSSIQFALSKMCGEEDIIVGDSKFNGSNVDQNIENSFSRNPHVNLKQIKLAVLPGMWNSLFKFTFVRNPWELVVSRYHWEKKGMNCSIENFRRWLPDYVDGEHTKPERNEQGNILQHVWEIGGGYINDLQSPFVYDADEILGVQFVGRYEYLTEDFHTVCRMLELEPPILPRLKAGFRQTRTYREFYDEYSKNLVGHAFAKDIEHFEYVF